MPTIIKPNELEFKVDENSLPQFQLQTLIPRLHKIVDSKHLIFDIRLLEPGKYSFPYHFHRYAEELIVIFSGTATLRAPEGFKIIEQGDIIFFEMGELSAHQLFNHSNSSCTYLDIRTTIGFDVTEYPDSGKINIFPNHGIYEKNTNVSYNKGEENIENIWDQLRNKL